MFSFVAFKKYIFNSNWLFLEKLLRILSGLIIGVWIARFLGPADYGVLSYGQSLIVIMSAFASLGIDNIVIKKIIDGEYSSRNILTSALYIKLFGGVVAITLVYAACYFWTFEDKTRLVLLMLSFTLLFKGFTVPELYYQSQVKAKVSSLINVAVLFLTSFLKLSLIYFESELYFFVLAIVFESCLLAIAYVYTYIKNQRSYLVIKNVDLKLTFSILKQSWPLMFSALLVILFMRVDMIMIEFFLDVNAVGIYASAVRISESWYIIPTIILTSIFPAILKAKKQDPTVYNRKMSLLYKVMISLSLVAAFALTFLADIIIISFFGAAYADSIPILKVHAWIGVLVSIQLVSSKWLLAENMSKFIFFRGALGLATNVLLNLIMIPKFGAVGAAWASIFTMVVSVILADIFSDKTRKHFPIKVSGFIPFFKF